MIQDARSMLDGMPCEACGGAMRMAKPWIYRCDACKFLYSSLLPFEGNRTGVGGLEALRRRNFEAVLKQLEGMRSLSGAHLLEVGSAWGWFLELAKRRGAKVRGIDPGKENVELARRNALEVDLGFFPEDLRDHGPYDIIVFNDVFEHIRDPGFVAEEAARLLRPSGILVINLPSSDGVLFKVATLLDKFGFSGWLERLWQKDFPSPHVSYFNGHNLRLLIERHAGDLICTRTFSLNSVARSGLGSRVRSSHLGAGIIAFAGLWVLSFALPILPSDIHVSIFEKSAPR